MALLTALFATALLMGLGLSILLLGSAETTLASRDRDAGRSDTPRAPPRASRRPISAPCRRGRRSPRRAPRPRSPPLPGQFVDSTLAPPAPWGGAVLDLRALTARLQAESDAAAASGSAPPWRLFDYGPLARLVPESASGTPTTSSSGWRMRAAPS